MTPKEKAEKLTDKFLTASFGTMEEYIPVPYKFAKECALIAVDEILGLYFKKIDDGSPVISVGFETPASKFWGEVKQEIEKL